MDIGIFARTFAGSSPLAVLSAARNAGYQAVQYNMACSGLDPLPLAISDQAAEAVHDAAAQTGVAIAAVSATYNMIHPNLGERERGRAAVATIAAAAGRMGTRLLTLCTGTCDPHDQWRHHPENSSDAAWQELCREFRLLLAIADRYDVRVGVEPELGNVVNSAARARELLDTLHDTRVRIVFDAANLFELADAVRQHDLIDSAVDLLGDSIAIAHAKDRLPNGNFGTAGAGVLDYRHYLTALRRAHFDGPLIAHGLAAGEAAKVATFLKSEIAAVDAGS